MDNLVCISNGQTVVSSRQVAENFSKEHKHVLASIRDIFNSAENSAQWFFESNYKIYSSVQSDGKAINKIIRCT